MDLIKTRDILEPEFVRRAAGALCTTPLTAADVLRALLSSPASTLVGVGQEALKTMLPKVCVYLCDVSITDASLLLLYLSVV